MLTYDSSLPSMQVIYFFVEGRGNGESPKQSIRNHPKYWDIVYAVEDSGFDLTRGVPLSTGGGGVEKH